MALPVSRNTTYGTDSPVLPNDLNALEDCVIGRKKPPWTRPFWPVLVYAGTGGVWAPTGAGAPGTPDITVNAITLNEGVVGVPCEEGDRVTGLRVQTFNNFGAGRTVTIKLYYGVGNGLWTQLGTATTVSAVAAWVPLTVPVTPQIIAVDGALMMTLNANGANMKVGLGYATFDRL